MVIGHARRGLARVYDQHQYLDEMREALDAWAAKLRDIVDAAAREHHQAGGVGVMDAELPDQLNIIFRELGADTQSLQEEIVCWLENEVAKYRRNREVLERFDGRKARKWLADVQATASKLASLLSNNPVPKDDLFPYLLTERLLTGSRTVSAKFIADVKRVAANAADEKIMPNEPEFGAQCAD